MRASEAEAVRYPRGDAAERLRTKGHLMGDYEAWAAHMQATAICHVPEAGRPDHVWWFGFDCAHAGDRCPIHERKGFAADDGEVYRDVPYVEAEVRSLAKQLASPVSGEVGGV